MADESLGIVRRSSKNELLERIKADALSKGNNGLCGWINRELGVSSDFPVRRISDDECESLYRVFGPLRENQSLFTEKPQEFVEFVCEAYTDAVRYSEFIGIEIEADSNLVSGGGTSKTYCFEAKFLEMLGLIGSVYETRLSFEYIHSHEDGKHNIEEYVNEQLEDLKASLSERLKEVGMVVKNKILYISKKQVEKAEQQ